jgi:hypothetical protein
VAGCCECGDEPSGSCATELVTLLLLTLSLGLILPHDKCPFRRAKYEGNINLEEGIKTAWSFVSAFRDL